MDTLYIPFEYELIVSEAKVKEMARSKRNDQKVDGEWVQLSTKPYLCFYCYFGAETTDVTRYLQAWIHVKIGDNKGKSKMNVLGKFRFIIAAANMVTTHNHLFTNKNPDWGEYLCVAGEDIDRSRNIFENHKLKIQLYGIFEFNLNQMRDIDREVLNIDSMPPNFYNITPSNVVTRYIEAGENGNETMRIYCRRFIIHCMKFAMYMPHFNTKLTEKIQASLAREVCKMI